MAKEQHSFSFKGELDIRRGILIEYAKKEGEEDKVFPLLSLLKQFDGDIVSISFKGECEPPTVSEFQSEDDEEDIVDSLDD